MRPWSGACGSASAALNLRARTGMLGKLTLSDLAVQDD